MNYSGQVQGGQECDWSRVKYAKIAENPHNRQIIHVKNDEMVEKMSGAMQVWD